MKKPNTTIERYKNRFEHSEYCFGHIGKEWDCKCDFEIQKQFWLKEIKDLLNSLKKGANKETNKLIEDKLQQLK